MTRRNVLLGALAWVAVVAAGSGVTWVVIDDAGQQVLSETPVAAVPSAVPPVPGRTPHAHRTRHTPPSSAAGATATPSARPTHRPSVPPTDSAKPSHDASPTEPPAPPAQQRTWRGTAGTVVARCTGPRVSLVSATPNDGYQVEVGSRGPAEVEVTFKGGGETQAKARCSAGAPLFSIEPHNDAGGDD